MTKHKFGIEGTITLVVLALVFFAVIQWIGEQLKFSPVIMLAMPPGSIFTDSEGIILFILVIGASIFLAALAAWAISRHKRK
jgi:hypothetical protein